LLYAQATYGASGSVVVAAVDGITAADIQVSVTNVTGLTYNASDVIAVAAGLTSAADSGTTSETSTACEFAFAVVGAANTTLPSWSWTNGFAQLDSTDIFSEAAMSTAAQVLTSRTTVDAAVANTLSAWGAIVVVLR